MTTSLERVGAALQFQEPDRVPCSPFMLGATRRVYGVTYAEWAQDGELAAKCQLQAQELIGYDAIGAVFDLSVEAAGFGQEIVFPVEDTPHPNYDNPLIKTPDDYAKLERIDPTKAPRMKEVLKYCDILMNERGSTVPVFPLAYGPLAILSMMAGAEKLLYDVIKYRGEVMAGLEIVTEVMVDYIKALAKTGVHGIMFDTLFASQCIMSRKMWLETEGQFVPRMAEAIREGGSMVMLHNCGTGPYFDVQLETMSPVVMSIAELPDDCQSWPEAKEKWGSKVALCGAVPPARFAFLGTPEEVKEECKKHIEMMAKGGGYVLALGCEFPPNGSLLNALAMMEAAELYGKYNGN